MVCMPITIASVGEEAFLENNWLSEAQIPPEYVDSPSIRGELDRHFQLRHELDQRQKQAEAALAEWRTALAWRWKCEVAGQRLYLQIFRQLETLYGANATYLQIIGPARAGVARTADELLADLQRLAASCEIMDPRPGFIAARLDELIEVVHQLDKALTWTNQAEEARRAAMLGQRLAQGTFQRSIQRIRSQVESCYMYETASPLRKTGD